jgi:hypothetical protein
VCNAALARVGQRQFLADLRADTSEVADVCRAIFDTQRDFLLEEVDWPFARRRQLLAALTSVTRTGWANVFSMPADCLAPRCVETGIRMPSAAQRIPFRVEDDAGVGRVLLCDLGAPELRYTSNAIEVLNPARWSPKFCDALSWRLAVELCLALPIKPAVAERMANGALLAVSQAKAFVWNEEQEDPNPDAESVTARQ